LSFINVHSKVNRLVLVAALSLNHLSCVLDAQCRSLGLVASVLVGTAFTCNVLAVVAVIYLGSKVGLWFS